jgi:hypothetical protein
MSRPTLSICSCLRHDAPYARAYFWQIRSMRRKSYDIVSVNVVCDDPEALRAAVAESGIENDMTVRLIAEHASDRQCNSINDKARQWATIGNQALDAAAADGTTHALVLEADLSIPYDAVDILMSRERDMIAPLVWLGGVFYDSWGFRDLAGKKIFVFQGIDMCSIPEPVEVSSVGSCVLLRGEILARGVRYRGTYGDGLLVGLCNDARALGYRCYADPMVAIVHPTLSWLEQVYRIESVRTVDASGGANELRRSSIVAGLHDEFVFDFLGQLLRSRALQAAPGAYSMRIEARPDRSATIDLRWRQEELVGAISLGSGVTVGLPIERANA